jgi:hypothetical protein
VLDHARHGTAQHSTAQHVVRRGCMCNHPVWQTAAGGTCRKLRGQSLLMRRLRCCSRSGQAPFRRSSSLRCGARALPGGMKALGQLLLLVLLLLRLFLEPGAVPAEPAAALLAWWLQPNQSTSCRTRRATAEGCHISG